MRLITYSAIFGFLVISLASSDQAQAQCRRHVIVGPGVTVVGPCQPVPPPVVVQPAPPAPPAPPAAAPPPPPPPPSATVVKPVVPCDYPPPRRVRRLRYRRVRLFTMGLYGEGTLFNKGGMGGTGFYAQLKLMRSFHLYGSVGVSGSCTQCNENNYTRVDVRSSVGLQYYIARPSWRLRPFVRGSLVYQAVTYRDPTAADESRPVLKGNQLGGELALGLEWRPLRWLIFSADIAYLGLSRMDDAGGSNLQQQLLQESRMGGVPTLNKEEHGVNFRFGAALRF